jgi:alkanesulfonate monooxygenase SsuD/methylene tetrahydromethanopterin reductase-like flavin-dependent oxidoreductase (luciferase family)
MTNLPGAPLGLALSSLTGLPPSELAALAAQAERRGFSALALTESYNDVLPLAAAVAGLTRSATIATAIANIGFRHPALMAMGAAAVDELSGGRFVLGLGVGTQWFDRGPQTSLSERPLAVLAEYVRLLRRLWAAGTSGCADGGAFYRLDDFRLDFEPLRPSIPTYLAAMGPGMLRLAGRLAEGVFLGLAPLETIPGMIEEVRAAGRGERQVIIAMQVRTCLHEDLDRAREGARASLPLYLTFPGYARHLRGLGYGAVVEAVQAAWTAGDRARAAAAIPDELLDRVTVYGPPERCRAGLERFRAAGLDLPIVSIRAAGEDWLTTLRRAIDVLAPDQDRRANDQPR